MATSFSAVERRNPPPRQKACAACTKAKRRCDFATPSCLRCTTRQLTCAYPPHRARATTRQRQGVAPNEFGDNVIPGPPSLSMPAELDFGDKSTTLPAPSSFSTIELESSFSSNTADCINPLLINYVNPYTRMFPDGLRVQHPVDVVQRLTHSSALAPPSARDLQYVADVVASHLQFAIDTFMKVPRAMVEELCSPWSHRFLYRDHVPRSVRDAQAACALYLAKNSLNSPVIMRSIESFCQDLLSSPLPTTAFDTLAYAHALLLYQIIRLFDGDIVARANADKDTSNLEQAALSLLAHVHFEDPLFPAPDLPLDPIGPTKLFWKQWLFQESARRTMLFIFFFLQTYRMVSGGTLIACDGKMGLVHSWTLSAYLWRARTPVEFAMAWRERNHFVVTNAGFRKVLAEAKADDVDSFGRILLSAMMGEDEADGWLAERGGSLREELCF